MFIDPKAVISGLSLQNVNTVVDMGTGSGVFALEIATKMNGQGMVYGVDVQENMLVRLANSAKEAKLVNIQPIHANIEKVKGVPLRDGIADLVIVSNVLYCADDRAGVLGEAGRLMRNGGQLLLIDWTNSHRGMGPDPAQVVPRAEGERLSVEAGFELIQPVFAGEYHWALLLKKKPKSSSSSSFAI
jgi:ubiquinone/menaquinone biosynthesis C-methylase UbiE